MTRQEWKQKITQLNAKHVKSGAELNAVLTQMVEISFEYLESAIAKVIIDAHANVIRRTPVDTGRLRAGWQVVTKKSDYSLPEVGDSDYMSQINKHISEVSSTLPISISEADVVSIMNNVEYVLALDAGWSKTQQGGFIGLMIAEITNEFTKLVNLKKVGA